MSPDNTSSGAAVGQCSRRLRGPPGITSVLRVRWTTLSRYSGRSPDSLPMKCRCFWRPLTAGAFTQGLGKATHRAICCRWQRVAGGLCSGRRRHVRGFLYIPGSVETDHTDGQVAETREGMVGVPCVGGVGVFTPGCVAGVVNFVLDAPVSPDVGMEICGGHAFIAGPGAAQDLAVDRKGNPSSGDLRAQPGAEGRVKSVHVDLLQGRTKRLFRRRPGVSTEMVKRSPQAGEKRLREVRGRPVQLHGDWHPVREHPA